jgi:PAS domain S-box-containing protein
VDEGTSGIDVFHFTLDTWRDAVRLNEPVSQKENDTMGDEEFICSKTDRTGIITYVNGVFCRVAGFTELELVGQSHNIVRHPDMPCVAYAWCWGTLGGGRDWRGIVKNRCKNGDHYWVDVTISPQVDAAGQLLGYFAVRRKPSRAQIAEVEPLYAQLCQAEGSLQERNRLSRQAIQALYQKSPLYRP